MKSILRALYLLPLRLSESLPYPNSDREKHNTHTSAWPGFPEAIDSCAVDRISAHKRVGESPVKLIDRSQTVVGAQTAPKQSYFPGIGQQGPPKVTFRVVGFIGLDDHPESKVAVLVDGSKHLVQRTMDHCRTVDTDFLECEVAGTYYSQFGGSVADSGDVAVPVSRPSITPKNLPLFSGGHESPAGVAGGEIIPRSSVTDSLGVTDAPHHLAPAHVTVVASR